MSDIIRVLRVIEYTGPRVEVEKHLINVLKGTKVCHNDVIIKAATLGDFPEILTTVEDEGDNNG